MCSRIFIRCQGHWCFIPPGAWRCLLATDHLIGGPPRHASCSIAIGRWTINPRWCLYPTSVPFPGLCSNIWLWRCTTGILAVVIVVILCIHLAVNSSSGKGSSGSPPPEPCPADWLYHQRKCYYLSETEKDWDSSQSFCSSHNSSLTVIENQQELNFIMKITKQDPWIGLHKTGEEFHWVNGTPLARNLLAVKGSGECAYIESDGVSSSGCSLTRGWVCKKTS
ncbi:C-type lectin domain family 2 member L-like isoform X4 [Mauremys reevesii]|uniref:C-type lectin domain family 2 member L-like isoform X4 n=1 Tax=Mauremys reevesii TaxID=260615 RepID=UPI00193FF19E|nr:C-type lectin domain family 2 member L-like isoform X4 [Mauremys reevesii]XP_039374422.1 C-type lectin domain family 2 member L-like isoform X4 [Mauremys reevesii]